MNTTLTKVPQSPDEMFELLKGVAQEENPDEPMDLMEAASRVAKFLTHELDGEPLMERLALLLMVVNTVGEAMLRDAARKGDPEAQKVLAQMVLAEMLNEARRHQPQQEPEPQPAPQGTEHGEPYGMYL